MSTLEDTFAKAWSQYGRGKIPARQIRLSLARKYTLDFAWPVQRVAVEVDGFLHYKQGMHQTIVGITRDHEKDNYATELGWTILRYTAKQLSSKEKRKAACEQILRVLKMRTLSPIEY